MLKGLFYNEKIPLIFILGKFLCKIKLIEIFCNFRILYNDK